MHETPTAATENPIFAIGVRAAALRASGADVITLAAGEPEVATAGGIVDAVAAAIRDPRTHHYSDAAGLPALRAEIAAAHPRVTRDDVQVAIGTKHALHLALSTIAGPGDDVLVARPAWPGHVAAADAVGARSVAVDAAPDGRVDIGALELARTPATRALVLANPSNPTGVVHPGDRIRQFADWCRRNDIWLVSDEVYGGLVYDGGFTSAIDACDDRSRLIVVDGVSKLHAMTGWRVGWLIGPATIVASARNRVGATITHVPAVTQHAALAALRDTVTPALVRARYRRSRDVLVDALRSIPGVSCPRPAGGMFAFPDLADLVGDAPDGAAAVAARLLEDAHVAVVPGAVFGAPTHLRIGFAVDPDRLAEAADRIAATLGSGVLA